MKKYWKIIIVATVALCLIVGIVACTPKEKTVSLLNFVDGNGNAVNSLNLGDFSYGDKPDLDALSFQITFDDNSTEKLTKDDPSVSVVSVTHDGAPLQEIPEVFDKGSWEITYGYKDKTAVAYFTVSADFAADFSIEGLPSEWIYSEIADFSSTLSVNGYPEEADFFSWENNGSLYYIQADKYREIVSENPFGTEQFEQAVLQNATQYLFDEFDVRSRYIDSGKYYMLAYMKECGNYGAQFTQAKEFTVLKETLTFDPGSPIPLEFYFPVNNAPGNGKLGDKGIPVVSSIVAYDSNNMPVQLSSDNWENPDEIISAADPADKLHKLQLVPTTENPDNFELDNLFLNYKLIIAKGEIRNYIGWDELDENRVVNRTLTLDSYEKTNLFVFEHISSFDQDFAKTFFTFCKITDSEGRRLPVYIDGETSPLVQGDDDASAKVVRKTVFDSYSYGIQLNSPVTTGTYNFTLSLIDNVNFYWKNHYGEELGSDPITLRYNVTANDPNGWIYFDNPVRLSDGKLQFTLSLLESAFDPSLIDTLTFTIDSMYTDSYGNSSYTDNGLTADEAAVEVVKSESSDGKRNLTVTVPVTLPAYSKPNYTICFTVTMQTAQNYEKLTFSTYTAITK